MKALDGYDQELCPVDESLAAICMHSVFAEAWNNGSEIKTKKILTFEEAVLGVENENYMNGIPRNTSCGYPDIMHSRPGFKGKQWYFGKDEQYDLTSKQCVQL